MPNKLTELEAARLAGMVEQMRGRAAAEFFADPGLHPDLQKDLQEGWLVLQERRVERAKAGVPLPPGGCLVLGDSSVVAQCLAEFHNRLAESLGVEVGAVKLRREHGSVVADVQLPEGWPTAEVLRGQLASVVASGRPVDKELIANYLRFLVAGLNEIYARDVRQRLQACRQVRAELFPRVVA